MMIELQMSFERPLFGKEVERRFAAQGEEGQQLQPDPLRSMFAPG